MLVLRMEEREGRILLAEGVVTVGKMTTGWEIETHHTSTGTDETGVATR